MDGGVPLEVDEIDKELTGVLQGWLGWSQSEFTTSYLVNHCLNVTKDLPAISINRKLHLLCANATHHYSCSFEGSSLVVPNLSRYLCKVLCVHQVSGANLGGILNYKKNKAVNIDGFEAPPQPKNRPAQVYFIPKLISAAVLPWSLGNLE